MTVRYTELGAVVAERLGLTEASSPSLVVVVVMFDLPTVVAEAGELVS